MRTWLLRLAGPLLLASLLLHGLGCGDSKGAVVEPTPGIEAPPPVVEVDPIPEFLDTFAQGLHNQIVNQVIEEEALGEVRTIVAQTKATKNDPYHYRSILRRVYQNKKDNKARLLFFRGAQLSEVGYGTMDVLREAKEHGLRVRKAYHLKRLDKTLGKLMTEVMTGEEGERITLSDSDRRRAEGILRSGRVSVKDPDAHSKLLKALTDGTNASAPMVKAKATARKNVNGKAKLIAEVELDLTDAVARYTWDMHYRNPVWADYFGERDRWKNKLEDEQLDMLQDHMRADLSKRLPKEDIPSLMRSFIPKGDQYQRLLKEYARYHKIVEEGGWTRITPMDGLRPGRQNKKIRDLKKRLAIEGYYPEDKIDDVFDDTLTQSILEFQRTHLLEETGRPNKWFWHEVRIHAKEKLGRLAITLDRWRETRVGNDTEFIWLNVPDYHAEVWKDGELQMRFPVVVGNTDMGCDLNRKRWTRINATPLQSGDIDTVVINPWWSIPDRIRREEILPEARKNPNYFEDAGLQCLKRSGDECLKVRRRPGGKNPLGRVKFLFPNIHHTFLHDTPHEKMFTFPRRFFSHGCMRLSKPMELAEYVLKADGIWDEANFKRLLGKGHEYTYKLNKPFRLHVEYYTTRVDDEGTLFFLHDVYNNDRYRSRGQKFEPRRCTPAEIANAIRPGSNGL